MSMLIDLILVQKQCSNKLSSWTHRLPSFRPDSTLPHEKQVINCITSSQSSR